IPKQYPEDDDLSLRWWRTSHDFQCLSTSLYQLRPMRAHLGTAPAGPRTVSVRSVWPATKSLTFCSPPQRADMLRTGTVRGPGAVSMRPQNARRRPGRIQDWSADSPVRAFLASDEFRAPDAAILAFLNPPWMPAVTVQFLEPGNWTFSGVWCLGFGPFLVLGGWR